MGGKGSGGRRRGQKKRKAEPLAEDREPYERQPAETVPAWNAFLVHRGNPERSLRKTTEKLGKSYQLIADWSARWSWTKRCNAWDREQDGTARNAQLDEIAAMNKRQARLGRDMQELARIELQRRLTAAKRKQKAGQLAPKDLKGITEIGAKLERLSRGEATEKVDAAVQVINIGGKAIKF